MKLGKEELEILLEVLYYLREKEQCAGSEVQPFLSVVELAVTSKSACTFDGKVARDLVEFLERLEVEQNLNLVPLLSNSKFFIEYLKRHKVARLRSVLADMVRRMARLQKKLENFLSTK